VIIKTNTLDKLERLTTLYRLGYHSKFIDQVLDKIILLEQQRAQQELAKFQTRLQAFEKKYHMSSQQFYQQYEHGELDDSADFMEWSSFYDLNMSTQQHLEWLIGGHN